MDDYYAGVRAGDVAVLARALTLIESSSPHHQPLAEELLTKLLPHTGQSIRVGFVQRLRDERAFESLDLLRAQIDADCRRARVLFDRLSL